MSLRKYLIVSALISACYRGSFAELPIIRQQVLRGKSTTAQVTVPEKVTSLLRPILDLRQQSIEQCGEVRAPSTCIQGYAYDQEQQRQKRTEELLTKLIKQQGSAADEALVVLMSFYIGESQEETDAVIARGGRMLKYLNKYRYVTPRVLGRAYSGSMLKENSAKADDFSGAIKAIRKGWHSTADNPEG